MEKDSNKYYFPVEIPNKKPDKRYLDIVDEALRASHFKIALANLYELLERRWEGENGLDEEIDQFKEIVKKRVGWIIDLKNLPKIKPSLQG